ncbi:hypothetical protein [Aquimarina algiphila]|uniref:hypothetical protein n=1 Tax=Aquimarina algiphila TaxID=2047982 RepID=UPI00232E96DB|nr:hypothetical protein [Aquimarina algiphila]
MKFIDPMPVTCESCNHEGKYKTDLLLAYKAKCAKCGNDLDYASDQMNETIDFSNETNEIIRVILGIEAYFNREYKGREVEEIKSMQDLLSVTINEFRNPENGDECIKKDLLNYLSDKYKVENIVLEGSILKALGIEIEKRKRVEG